MSGYVPNPPKNHRYEEAKPVDIHAQLGRFMRSMGNGQ